MRAGTKKKWGYSHPPPFGSRRVFGAWSLMVDGWSGIPGLEVVVVVAVKDVDVAFTEVPSVVVRGVGDRNEEVVGKETGIGLWVITGFAVEKMMANPARLRARRRLKENCIIFFLCKKKKRRRFLGVLWWMYRQKNFKKFQEDVSRFLSEY